MIVAVLIWLIVSMIVGVAAERRGRAGVPWIFAVIVLSPLIAAVVLAMMPDRRYERVRQRLAAYDRAIADGTLRDTTRR